MKIYLIFFTTSTFCFSWFASSFIFTARCSWTSFARNLKITNFCKFLIVLFDIKRRGEKKFCLFQRFFFEKTSSFSYLETILCEFFPTYVFKFLPLKIDVFNVGINGDRLLKWNDKDSRISFFSFICKLKAKFHTAITVFTPIFVTNNYTLHLKDE